MSPFRPSGEHARWRVLYELLGERPIGSMLSYEEMGAALELDPVKDRQVMQLAMRRAAREFEVIDKHAVDCVPTVGYRIVEPPQHLMLAQRHQRRASRSLSRGQSKVVNVDLRTLDADTRRAFEVVAAAFALQADFNARLDVRQQHLERAVEAVTKKTSEHAERTEEELATLRERLRRLEEKTSDST